MGNTNVSGSEVLLEMQTQKILSRRPTASRPLPLQKEPSYDFPFGKAQSIYSNQGAQNTTSNILSPISPRGHVGQIIHESPKIIHKKSINQPTNTRQNTIASQLHPIEEEKETYERTVTKNYISNASQLVEESKNAATPI